MPRGREQQYNTPFDPNRRYDHSGQPIYDQPQYQFANEGAMDAFGARVSKNGLNSADTHQGLLMQLLGSMVKPEGKTINEDAVRNLATQLAGGPSGEAWRNTYGNYSPGPFLGGRNSMYDFGNRLASSGVLQTLFGAATPAEDDAPKGNPDPSDTRPGYGLRPNNFIDRPGAPTKNNGDMLKPTDPMGTRPAIPTPGPMMPLPPGFQKRPDQMAPGLSVAATNASPNAAGLLGKLFSAPSPNPQTATRRRAGNAAAPRMNIMPGIR